MRERELFGSSGGDWGRLCGWRWQRLQRTGRGDKEKQADKRPCEIQPHTAPPPSILLTEQKFNRINIFISAVDANSKNEDKQITFVTDTATFTDHTNWYKKGPGKPANFRFQKSGERGRVSQVDGQVGEGGQVCPVTTCWEGKSAPPLLARAPLSVAISPFTGPSDLP